MSDLGMFRSPLQHRSLEAITYQWDGTKEQGISAVEWLQRELSVRDGRLLRMQDRSIVRTVDGRGHTLEITIMRTTDCQEWSGTMEVGQWLVLWLHQSRLHHVEVLDERYGEVLFRPVAPIVTLVPTPPADPRVLPEGSVTSVIRFPHGEDRETT